MQNPWALPPKRWQTANDPKYDEIRGRKFFKRLLRRKRAIPFVRQAYELWKSEGITQQQAADALKINVRELRDYAKLVETSVTPSVLEYWAKARPEEQSIIDCAYAWYCESLADLPFAHYLEAAAISYGKKPRPIIELWEVDPTYYPTNYSP